MLKGFKTQLKPNNQQVTKFAQHCGVARYVYNWGLDVCFKAIEARNKAKEKGERLPKFPTSIDLHKKLNAEVKTQHPWFYQSSKCAPKLALKDLENAWKRKLKMRDLRTEPLPANLSSRIVEYLNIKSRMFSTVFT